MKIAYIHVLPVEYYPPARNALQFLSRRSGWRVKAWTTENRRGLQPWRQDGIEISRPLHFSPRSALPLRIIGYLAWHLTTATAMASWRPDVIVAVEPHSALAVWLYYKVLRGKAPLFIHHHEYYAPEDFSAPGMRLLRSTQALERRGLFPIATWISETNQERLRLLREWTPEVTEASARVMPNYPPKDWILRAESIPVTDRSEKLRMIYLGAASFEDTFIREAALWAADRSEEISLHITGNNVSKDVWTWLRSIGADNITTDPAGCDYEELPALFRRFDVGLVLYKGNTLNFVHNVPNKAIEYLACGLEVWYPAEMAGMRLFHETFPDERLREMDFMNLPTEIPAAVATRKRHGDFPFTNEAAMKPLADTLDGFSHPLET